MAQQKTTRKSNMNRSRRPSRPGRLSSPHEKAAANIKRTIPQPTLPRRELKFFAGLVVAIVVIAALNHFYQKIYSSPQRVFDAMIANNLSTQSVTRTVDQPLCINGTGSSENLIQINYLPRLQVHCVTTLNSSANHSSLTVESLGTQTADYEHYSNIQNSGQASTKYDQVYKIWLKNRGTNDAQQLLIKSLFNPVLFGDLTPAARQRVGGELKSSYIVNYAKVQTRYDGNRKMYQYDVQVKLPEFSKAWNDYIGYYGFTKVYLIKPGTYTDTDKLSISIFVDTLSRQVRAVNFQGNTEAYSAYGISRPLDVPAQTYSAAQLQKTLNAAQR